MMILMSVKLLLLRQVAQGAGLRPGHRGDVGNFVPVRDHVAERIPVRGHRHEKFLDEAEEPVGTMNLPQFRRHGLAMADVVR